MNRNITEIENSILRMTAVVRQELATEIAHSFGEETNPDVRPLGWWVLACGEPLDNSSEEERDAARTRLLQTVRMAGLVLPENIWIWDELNQVQLVISTVPTLKRADRLAKHLRSKNLSIRIIREKI